MVFLHQPPKKIWDSSVPIFGIFGILEASGIDTAKPVATNGSPKDSSRKFGFKMPSRRGPISPKVSFLVSVLGFHPRVSRFSEVSWSENEKLKTIPHETKGMAVSANCWNNQREDSAGNHTDSLLYLVYVRFQGRNRKMLVFPCGRKDNNEKIMAIWGSFSGLGAWLPPNPWPVSRLPNVLQERASQ